jgi:hypothetical protein
MTRPKGTPTHTNLYALASIAAGRERFSRRIARVDAPHVRRCIAAGLLEIDGADLVLTPAGIAAVNLTAAEWNAARPRVRLAEVHPDHCACLHCSCRFLSGQ